MFKSNVVLTVLKERAQMDNERKVMQEELESLKKKIGSLLKNQQNS